MHFGTSVEVRLRSGRSPRPGRVDRPGAGGKGDGLTGTSAPAVQRWEVGGRRDGFSWNREEVPRQTAVSRIVQYRRITPITIPWIVTRSGSKNMGSRSGFAG